MRNTKKIGKGLLLVTAIIGMFFLITWIVMSLWNLLLPEIIGVKTISFWQAMGILVLCKILFGGFKGKFDGQKFRDWKNYKHRIENSNMTDEEKARLKEIFQRKFGQNPFCKK